MLKIDGEQGERYTLSLEEKAKFYEEHKEFDFKAQLHNGQINESVFEWTIRLFQQSQLKMFKSNGNFIEIAQSEPFLFLFSRLSAYKIIKN